MPTSTAAVSESAVVPGVALDAQTEQGQVAADAVGMTERCIGSRVAINASARNATSREVGRRNEDPVSMGTPFRIRW